MNKREFLFNINNNNYAVSIYPYWTLLEVLRDDLGLTGAKRGCNQGVCGTCTVLIDGKPVRSCITLAVEVWDKKITTIEGLVVQGAHTPVQEAFISEGAIQCGFCTPGMVLTAEALLDQNPTPTEDEVLRAISGNLCRCTGYYKIKKAILKVAAHNRRKPG